MDLIMSVAVVQLMSAAAESPPEIKCNVTQLDDGSFRYDLSEPPICTSDCRCSWENRNGSVVAVKNNMASNVKNLTNRSITLSSCQDFMKFRCNNEVVQEAFCTVNCSELISAGGPIRVNSTETCVFPRWCPDPLTIGLIIGAVAVAVMLGIVGCGWKFCKSRGGPASPSHTSAEEESKMMNGVEMSEISTHENDQKPPVP